MFRIDFNPYSRIQRKNPTFAVTERVLREKSRAQRCIICICFYALDFFSGNRARSQSQKLVYFCSDWHISPHNSICHFKLTSQDSPTDTLSGHIIFMFLVPTVTSPAIFLDFSFQQALPKNSRISLNFKNI